MLKKSLCGTSVLKARDGLQKPLNNCSRNLPVHFTYFASGKQSYLQIFASGPKEICSSPDERLFRNRTWLCFY